MTTDTKNEGQLNEENNQKTNAKEQSKPTKKVSEKEVSRTELNDKARYDYGIMNADTMDEKQLNAEIKSIDDQATEARKADEKAAKEAAKSE